MRSRPARVTPFTRPPPLLRSCVGAWRRFLPPRQRGASDYLEVLPAPRSNRRGRRGDSCGSGTPQSRHDRDADRRRERSRRDAQRQDHAASSASRSMSGSGCTGLTCTKSTPSIPKTRATRTTPLSDPRRQWLLDVNSNQGLRISAGEASVSGVPPRCNVTAFTAFTGFHPANRESCQDGSHLRDAFFGAATFLR